MSLREQLCERLAGELEQLAAKLRSRSSDAALQAVVLRLDGIHHTLALCLSSVAEVDRPRPDV